MESQGLWTVTTRFFSYCFVRQGNAIIKNNNHKRSYLLDLKQGKQSHYIVYGELEVSNKLNNPQNYIYMKAIKLQQRTLTPTRRKRDHLDSL